VKMGSRESAKIHSGMCGAWWAMSWGGGGSNCNPVKPRTSVHYQANPTLPLWTVGYWE
jgi:hypothetical protein